MVFSSWLGELQRKLQPRARRRKPTGHHAPAGTRVEPLELRLLLSAGNIVLKDTGKLRIVGTPDDDTAIVSIVGGDTVRVVMQTADTTHDESFPLAQVEKIVFFGQEGNDSFNNMTALRSNAFGGDGNDTFLGGSGHDLFKGQAGNDWADGGDGRDTLKGFSGQDTLLGGKDRDLLVGGGGRDYLAGGSGNDTLKAQGGNADSVFGEGGDDYVDGGAGDDWLSGGAGNDWIRGRTGNDRLVETADVDFVFTKDALIGLGHDTIEGIKEAILTGGSGPNLIDAGEFMGSTTLNGGDGADTIIGSVKADSIVGGAGNDFINARNGMDTVLGQNGDDTIFGGAGGDLLDGGAGHDFLDGQGGSLDTLLGRAGNDTLMGGDGNDLLQGGDDSDWLYGGNDNDTLFGEQGEDILFGGSGDDRLRGNAHHDILIGGSGADELDGGAQDDILIGGTTVFDDIPFGLLQIHIEWMGTADYLTRVATISSHAHSSFYLRAGETVLDDGQADTLTGGSGDDWFFQPAPNSPEADVPTDLQTEVEKSDDPVALMGTPGRNQVAWPRPMQPQPEYQGSVIDPTFGTTIRRISNDPGKSLSTVYNTGGIAEEIWSNTLRNRYVTDSPFSIDGQYLHLRSYDTDKPYQLVLDGSDYNPEFIAILPNTNFRWSQDPSRPHLQYSLVKRLENSAEDDLIYEYDITTGQITRTIVLPFNKFYSGKETIAFVDGKQYVALLGVDKAHPDGDTFVYIVNLDYVEGVESPVVASFNVTAAGNGVTGGPRDAISHDTLTYSPDGRYVLISYEGTNTTLDSWRLLDVDLQAGTISPHVMPAKPLSNVTAGGDPEQGHFPVVWSHPTFAYGGDGTTVYVVGSSGSWQGAEVPGVETVNGRVGGLLAFNTSTNGFKSLTDPDNEAVVSHVTATNFDNPGYVFASYSPLAGGTKYRGEIVAISLDNPADPTTGLIRLAHHNTDPSDGCWQCQAHLVVNRDASKLIFSSTWGETHESISTYVIDLALP